MLALERSWALTILESFAPERGPGLAPRPGEVDYMATFDKMYVNATPLASLGLRLAIWLVALSPLFTMFRLSTFKGLPSEQRTEQLGRLLESNVFAIREGTFLIKTVASLALLGSESVRARSGFDGVPSKSLPVARGDA